MCCNFFQKIANYEKWTVTFSKKLKISENLLTNFPKNRKLQKMHRPIVQKSNILENVLTNFPKY